MPTHILVGIIFIAMAILEPLVMVLVVFPRVPFNKRIPLLFGVCSGALIMLAFGVASLTGHLFQ